MPSSKIYRKSQYYTSKIPEDHLDWRCKMPGNIFGQVIMFLQGFPALRKLPCCFPKSIELKVSASVQWRRDGASYYLVWWWHQKGDPGPTCQQSSPPTPSPCTDSELLSAVSAVNLSPPTWLGPGIQLIHWCNNMLSFLCCRELTLISINFGCFLHKPIAENCMVWS